SHREFAPLKQADDAILINTDSIPFLEVVDKISDLIKEKVNVL
ncbi:MAG: (d)CMP kinase, partial [Clostridia bacterium]|nr:(d)CMP kinase [Clostridia bacterium]